MTTESWPSRTEIARAWSCEENGNEKNQLKAPQLQLVDQKR